MFEHTPQPDSTTRVDEASSIGAERASWLVVAVLRVFLAVGWLRACVEKVVDGGWWRGDGLRTFLVTERSQALPFVRPIMDRMQHPLPTAAVSLAVVLAELACGVMIASGRGLRTALRIGVVLNVAFVLCGRVNPSAFYLVMEMVLLLAVADGAFAGQRRTSSRHALTVAVVAGAAAAAMLPFIRTLRPADVIADPAAMLAFLAVLAAAGNAARWALHRPGHTAAASVAARIVEWAQARPPAVPARVERAALPSFGPPRVPVDAVAPRGAGHLVERPRQDWATD